MIKYHSNKYRLIIVLHHIIIDGSSFDYFVNELSKYYNDPYYKNSITIKTQLLRITKLSKELSKYVELNKERSKFFWKERLSDIEFLDINFLKVSTRRNNLEKTKLSVQTLSDVTEIRFKFNKEVLFKLNQLKKSIT
ncbi:MAG: condensation domain-containing protein [Rickettsiaceae bacterium]|nr:condensation domain-containing protein [Rickettsiaceae bacterium]